MLDAEAVIMGLKYAQAADVAERTGIHYQTVCRIARGDFDEKTVSYWTVKRLSDYLLSDHYMNVIKKKSDEAKELLNEIAEIRAE